MRDRSARAIVDAAVARIGSVTIISGKDGIDVDNLARAKHNPPARSAARAELIKRNFWQIIVVTANFAGTDKSIAR